MKRFIITILAITVLVGSVFATDWKKVDTKVFSDEAWYQFTLDRPDYTYTKITDNYIKETLSVSPWIENQIVKETFIDVDSIEYKNAIARASGYASYKDYQNEIAYYNTLAIANILSNIGTIAGDTLK